MKKKCHFHASITLLTASLFMVALLVAGCGKSETIVPALTNGMTEAEFILAVGKPTSEMVAGGKKILSYDGVMVSVVDGHIDKIPPTFYERVETAREKLTRKRTQDAKACKKYRKKGLVKYSGEWITPNERDRKILAARNARQRGKSSRESQEYASKAPARKTRVQTCKEVLSWYEKGRPEDSVIPRDRALSKDRALSRDRAAPRNCGVSTDRVVYTKYGKPVDYGRLVRPRKITIIAFISNKHAFRCKTLVDKVRDYISEEPKIKFHVIEVENTTTATAEQYHVTKVPSIRVFGKNQKMIGQSTSTFSMAAKYINVAREAE